MTMKRLLIMVAIFGWAILAMAVPQEWSVDVSRVQPCQFNAYHGETMELKASFFLRGQPYDVGGADFALFWQTNGMGAAYWSAPATAASNTVSAVFTGAMDPGAPLVYGFLGSTGSNYRASFAVRFAASPGATPNELPLPVQTIDFAKVAVLNAPWATTNALEASIALAAQAATNYTDATALEINGNLSTNYYTAAETDDAINALAAYYITSNSAGDAFPSYAALTNATVYYSGGEVRTPTRNDYAIVLADETHGGAEWRYIYAVHSAGDPGQWEAQYPIETNDYEALSNKPQINGVTLSGNKTSSDLGLLGNSGNQTIDGTLTVQNTEADGYERLRAGDFGFDHNGQIHVHSGNNEYIIRVRDISGTLALLSDMYDAVQQIAPEFTAKAYALNDLCSYNGVVYRCKSAYTATAQSTKPNADTTHWIAKKVSELFLPLTGGTMTGDIYVDGKTYSNDGYYFGGAEAAGIYLDEMYVGSNFYQWPLSSGTYALLQNLAPNFSTSATYAIDDLCVYEKRLYRCTTAITTAEAWTAAHWTEATVEDVLAAIRSALGGKAPLASPAFTGTPTAPTPTAGDNSTNVATTAFVQNTIPSWAKSATKPSYTLNEVCPDTENWLGKPGTTAAGKSIKVLAKTVNGVIDGGMTVTSSSNNDNNTTKYRYDGVTATRNGTATDYLFDTSSQSGIVRRSELASLTSAVSSLSNNVVTVSNSIAAIAHEWSATNTTAVISYHYGKEIVAIPSGGTLTANLSGWNDGVQAFVVLQPSGAYTVASNVEYCGYGTWPTNTALCVAWPYAGTLYVNPIITITE